MKKIGLCLMLLAVVAGFLVSGCRKVKRENCREMFEKYYEANVEGYMAAMPGVNPVVSRKVAEYMVNRVFQLDSTFAYLKGKALEAFIEKHERLLQREHDSILAVYGNCRARFEKYYEVNVDGFMRAMPDVDKAVSRKRAEYAVNRAYEIDSAFVWMDGQQLTDFVNSIRPQIQLEYDRAR